MSVIKAYKGFNKDLSCKGFQYEVGKEYELPEGKNVIVCETGFHACESPLEVLDYYPMIDDDCNENRFCEVEQSGDIDRESRTTKVASSRIRIKAEIGLAGLIKAGIEWIKEVTKVGKVDTSDSLNDKGGDSAQIGSSGYSAQIGSSGDYAQIGSSGDSAKIISTGNDSVICCAGNNSIVKAKLGSWVTLAEWEYSDEKNRYVPKMVKTFQIDGKTYKPDTWYRMKDCEIMEVK